MTLFDFHILSRDHRRCQPSFLTRLSLGCEAENDESVGWRASRLLRICVTFVGFVFPDHWHVVRLVHSLQWLSSRFHWIIHLNICIPVLLKNVKNRFKNYVICIVYKLCLAVCFIVERNPSDVSAFIQMAQCVLWLSDWSSESASISLFCFDLFASLEAV